MPTAAFPGKQVGKLADADVFVLKEGMKEAVAEEFGHGTGIGGGYAVEAAFLVGLAVGGDERDVRGSFVIFCSIVHFPIQDYLPGRGPQISAMRAKISGSSFFSSPATKG